MKELNEYFRNLIEETLTYTHTEGNFSYIHDPYFNLDRSRVTAEVCKALIRSDNDAKLIDRMINWLISRQNEDGSWDEEHPKYAKKSALVTAFVAEALLLWAKKTGSDKYDVNLKKARDYVLASEISPGYYKKSESYLADHLNVDASCGAFLAEYGEAFKDDLSIEAAQRAAINCIKNQTANGVYPYTTIQGGSPYPYPYHIPCIHYQGVTIYYLIKIQQVIKSPELGESLNNAAAWLAKVQFPDGRFDWSKSGLMFAYYLTGAYAFSAASFKYARLNDNSRKSIQVLKKHTPSIANRWEKAHIYSYPLDIYTSMKTAMIGNFPYLHRLNRLGYGIYRNYSRRRYSNKIDDRLFNILCKTLKIKASTIDPSANYLDLFMTSEIIDCLSYTRECLN